MSGHTPGPWELHDRSISTVVAKGRVVAACGGYQDNTRVAATQDENGANARLVAAAPELLEALSDLFDQLECLGMAPDKMPSLKKARAAIAIATGKEAS